MDTFSAQEIATQQISITPPQNKSLRKFLNMSSWIILFALLPLTVLIFLSQDSIPGDFFYPVKRGMEGVVLAAASVNPATRVAFRTDLTEARFKEAQILAVLKSNAGGLLAFADEVQATQIEVTNLKNDTERKDAEGKLLAKVDQYQDRLSGLQTKTEQNLINYRFQEIPTSSPIPTSTSLPLFSFQPSSSPTPPPAKSDLTSTGVPIPTSIPTLTPVQTVIPAIPAQQENTQVAQQEKIAKTIRETRDKLDKIKKDLEEKRSEDRQRSEKDEDGENPNKNNSSRKTESQNRQK